MYLIFIVHMYTLISFYIQLQVHPFQQVSPKQRLLCRERNTDNSSKFQIRYHCYSKFIRVIYTFTRTPVISNNPPTWYETRPTFEASYRQAFDVNKLHEISSLDRENRQSIRLKKFRFASTTFARQRHYIRFRRFEAFKRKRYICIYILLSTLTAISRAAIRFHNPYVPQSSVFRPFRH